MNNCYYNKYLKYKHKYQKLQLQLGEDKKMKSTDFDIQFNDDMHTNIMKLEFAHDLDGKKIKNQKFYDLVKQKEIEIDKNIPSDVEGYLKQAFVNYTGLPLKDKLVEDKSKLEIKDLSGFTAIFDNATFTKPLGNKLKLIFGIGEYYQTFIGNCEDFLNAHTKINPEFLDSKGKLRVEFLRQAVLIGFLPKSLNALVLYAPFNDFRETFTTTLEKELIKLQLFCTEAIGFEKQLGFSGVQADFLADLKKIKKSIGEILTKATNTEKETEYRLKKQLIEKVVFSMKEARDSFYISEMLQIQKINPNIIFITTDKILTFRCVFNKISVLNILNGMIRYIIICSNSKIKVIGNPFELFDESNSVTSELNSKQISSIITDIVTHPVLGLKQNFTYYSKYMVRSVGALNKLGFLMDCVKNFDSMCIYKPNKKTQQIMETFYMASYGINRFEELINILRWYANNFIDDVGNNFPTVTDARDIAYGYIHGIESDIKIHLSTNNIKLDQITPSTYSYLFIEFFCNIVNIYKIWTGVFFLLKMIKKYYPESVWNYKEIFLIKTGNRLESCKEENETFYQMVLRLVDGDETVFNGKEYYFQKDGQVFPYDYY